MKKITFFFLLIFIIKFSNSQTSIDNFFQTLIYNPDSISSFVDSDELNRSTRLGISYKDIKNKFMISYDIDDSIKNALLTRSFSNHEYETKILENENEFSKIELFIPRLNYSKIFYFKSGKYIAPSTYYSRNWTTYTSKYFLFKISEPKYFNEYCIKKLDEFVDKTADLLKYSSDEKNLLETQKIYYIICKDENEIKTVSGFDTRGIYITAFDEVITTYNTHYHELAHLLMNYKLKNLSLYTLPFFMEGFAVAVGGRGGLAPRVVTDIGLYLQAKGLLDYDSIITNDGFYNENASLTYPLAGLYNLFLMNKIGMDTYIELYKKANGEMNYLTNIKLQNLNLPSNTDFQKFEYDYGKDKCINNEEKCTYNGPLKSILSNISPGSTDPCIKFQTGNNFIFLYPIDDSVNKNFQSKIFDENIKKPHNHEAYLIKVDTVSIKVYNCYNNELITSYDKNFSVDSSIKYIFKEDNLIIKNGKAVKISESFYYSFKILKSVFDIPFKFDK